MAVLLVLPQPQAQQLLRAAEFLQQRGPDGHPRASPLARAQFSVAPVLLERALPCSLRRPRKLQAAAAALLPKSAGKNGAFAPPCVKGAAFLARRMKWSALIAIEQIHCHAKMCGTSIPHTHTEEKREEKEYN